MNEREIRNVLIEYLRAQYPKARFFKEKCIGSSICDLMAVTDKLIGYEIKSDLDDYQRLDRQSRAYNQFFDECYLVVGASHARTAPEIAPRGWGILVVSKNGVEVLRPDDKRNGLVSVRKQLSILWKIELKNILVKNRLPLYPQKEKGYIADRIAESVEEKKLKKQIIEELLSRDYSTYQAIDPNEREEDEETEGLPQEDLVDTLSEVDLSQFTLDKWIALYAKATALREEKEGALGEVQERKEHAIKYTDITVSLGAPWIGVGIVNEFANQLFQLTKTERDPVLYEPITGAWVMKYRGDYWTHKTKIMSEYGTHRYNGIRILEAILNLREIKVFDGTTFNEEETVAALEKKRLIEEKFRAWIWQDEDRIWEVEEAYEQMFARYENQTFDGSELRFPDMAEGFALYDYQKDAVQKILKTNNTLLAFDVGAGKTYIMIAAAMKMRQEGLSHKNMFVVPNNIVGQWERIFCDLYPRAKVLTVEPKGFKSKARSKILRQMKEGDYDGIIIAYSCFEMIPLSNRFLALQLEEQIEGLQRELKMQSNYALRQPLESRRHALQKQLGAIWETVSTPYYDLTFDELEINTLFVDEAHNYKNIPIRTQMRNVRGVNAQGSEKCKELLQKVRCVQQANGGRGVVFATGTPLCNSISDAYAMQLYLQYEELAAAKLDVFDNWVKTFARPEQSFEVDVDTKKYRIVRRFTSFFNLPELSRMFSGIACFYAVDGRKYLPQSVLRENVVIPRNAALASYMQEIAERTEQIRAQQVDRSKDNMLKVCIDGKKAALDLRLVEREQPLSTAKLYRLVEQVMDVYCRFPSSAQLVFCDWSTPKDTFNLYAEIKQALLSRGVKEEEVAFIHSFQTESRKVQLFQDVNDAKVRILLGSTFKLGIGANVQERLKAVHHLDVPWRPADMVQREGRILRRGNRNDEVFLFRYIAEGSFDSYSWQVLETKQRFISQFLAGSAYQRSVADLEDNVLNYAEVKAIALNEPLMKALAEKQNELKNYRILRLKEQEDRERLQKERAEKDGLIVKLKENLYVTRENARFVRDNLVAIREALLTAMDALAPEEVVKSGVTLLEFCTFLLRTPKAQSPVKPQLELARGGAVYVIEAGDSAAGNARRIYNRLQKLDEVADKIERNIQEYTAYVEEVGVRLNEKTSYDEAVARCERELEALLQKIKAREE